MEKQKKCIGYVRVSTDQQDLTRQKALINEYCALNDLHLIKIIGDKESGANSQRKGYKELQQINKDVADVVIMTEISRLSREDNILKPLSLINEILEEKIDIVFLENNVYNVRTFKGGENLNLTQIIILSCELEASAKERKKIVGRMLSGRKNKFKEFDSMCIGRVPFGYTRKDNPNFVINKTPKSFLVRNDNAETVSNIFNWIINGMTLKEIALKLQSLGIKTNLGDDFSTATVATIIHNPIYKGDWTFSGETIEGDAIVSKEVWEKAKLALKENRLLKINRNVNFNPLKGLFKCPCGHSMYIVKNRTKGNPNHRQYRCAVKKNKYDQTVCNNGGADADTILQAVWNAVLCSNNGKEFKERNNSQIQIINEEIENIESNIRSNTEKIDSLNKELSIISVNISKVENPNLINMMVQQFETVENQIKNYKALNEDLAKEKLIKERTKEQLSQKDILENDIPDEEKAVIYQRLISKIVYYSEVMHRGFLVIDFKNGVRIIYMILTSGTKKIIQLPSGWKFEDRKVIVEYMKLDGFQMIKYNKYYGTFELENEFPDIVRENNILNN